MNTRSDPLADPLAPAREGPLVVYDGECPFCAAYVRMTRLRESAGPVTLVDARAGGHPVLDEIRGQGLDLDRGMVVKMDGRLYHGDAAMTALALMTTPSGLFNRTMRALFRRPGLARVIYPPMVAGRNLTLRLLGRRPIGAQ
ncbi:DCC1-like thiol-disulfide oxidoreductase family protein [Palleronia sp. KMU-117]|uniref:DCC1-like thiol-disulfide oxidoreductase family protein n=1 Tax=Palleronia sp. KMU-117 TaxID=3434108 RepID=UPI003D71BF0C